MYMHVRNFDSSYAQLQTPGKGRERYTILLREREREKERDRERERERRERVRERPTVGRVPCLIRMRSEVMKDRPCCLVS